MRFISLFLGTALLMEAGWGLKNNMEYSWFILVVAILNLMSFAIDEVTERIKKHIDEKEKK